MHQKGALYTYYRLKTQKVVLVEKTFGQKKANLNVNQKTKSTYCVYVNNKSKAELGFGVLWSSQDQN